MTTSNLHLTFRDGGTGDAGDPYTGLDRFGRLVETLWKQGTSDRVRSQYGRNRLGGVTWRRDEEAHAQDVDTEDNLYGYDALQQVSERQRGDLTGTAPDYTGITSLQQQEGWTYDSTGNWAAYSDTSPTNAQTRTHNRANEITQIASAPGNVEPGYDPVGNMLTLPKELGLSAEQYDLTWDAWNRLVAVKDGGTTVATYTYDGLTRRLTNSNATETRHYYYNSAWREVEERVDGAAIAVDRQYTWGLRDRWDLLRRKRSVGGSLDEALYVLRDYLDPVAIVDGDGAVVERYAYDVFGNVRLLAPDFTARTASAFDWDLLFHDEFRDTDTKLYNYGYRYYSARLGNWLSRDPIGESGGYNLYGIARNAPVNFQDYLGEKVRIHINPDKCEIVLELLITIYAENEDENKKLDLARTAKRIENSIRSHWNKATEGRLWGCGSTISGCKISFSVHVEKDYKSTTFFGASGDNRIEITSRDIRYKTESDWLGLWGIRGDDWIYAHEAGHLFDLDDDYYPKTQIPYPGHENHMMGDFGAPVAPHEVEDILKKHKVTCPCECCCPVKPEERLYPNSYLA